MFYKKERFFVKTHTIMGAPRIKPTRNAVEQTPPRPYVPRSVALLVSLFHHVEGCVMPAAALLLRRKCSKLVAMWMDDCAQSINCGEGGLDDSKRSLIGQNEGPKSNRDRELGSKDPRDPTSQKKKALTLAGIITTNGL